MCEWVVRKRFEYSNSVEKQRSDVTVLQQETPGPAIPQSADCCSSGVHGPVRPPLPTPSWEMKSLMVGQRLHTATWATLRSTAAVSPWSTPRRGPSRPTQPTTPKLTTTTTRGPSQTAHAARRRVWTARARAWGPFSALRDRTLSFWWCRSPSPSPRLSGGLRRSSSAPSGEGPGGTPWSCSPG